MTCTDRERQILSIISSSIKSNGYPPSVRELCEQLGVASTNGMIEHLKTLQKKGLIMREIATARAIRITDEGQVAMAMRDEP